MLVTTLSTILALALTQTRAQQLYGTPKPSTPKQPIGANCSQSRTRLQVGTYELSGDCENTAYCAANSTCVPKACRKDEYPFGYPQGGPFPPRCPDGQFCSDEGDACQPLQPVGSPCQLNRDDQCAPPPNVAELASFPNNVNGSVCLNFQCMWANVTEGQPCVIENTPYIAYTADAEFAFVISRGNCHKGLYCDAQSKSCIKHKLLGANCSADKECGSGNCSPDNVCVVALDAPDVYPKWIYATIGGGIVGTLLLLLVTLFFVHTRTRDEELEKRMMYWRQQSLLRSEIMQLKEGYSSSVELPYLDSPNSVFKESQSKPKHGASGGPGGHISSFLKRFSK
ncbi:hypothetical protein AURDEDRAFT_158477 [Auricularia subglabra TFB-10046 SS5]|nr:hypothetical protein AURDEDRAFT_158477 [Auricularia subglabra TFB-10046 SS5]